MKRRTIFILFLTHIALLVGGFYLGKLFSFRDAMRQANLIGSIDATGMFHEYLRVQLEQGSCSEAAEALLSYERMLDQFKGRDGALVDRFHGTDPPNFNEGTHLISGKGPTPFQVVPFVF